MVADNPDCKIKLKVFHSEIQNNHVAIKFEVENYEPIPVVKNVSEIDVQENYLKIKSEIESIFQIELKRIDSNNIQKKQEDDTSSNGNSIQCDRNPCFPREVKYFMVSNTISIFYRLIHRER